MPWGSSSVLRILQPDSALGRTRQGIVAGITGPAKVGHGHGFCDAGVASGTRILAAAVGVENQARSRLAQRQGLFQRVEHQLGGHLGGQVPVHHPPRTGYRAKWLGSTSARSPGADR